MRGEAIFHTNTKRWLPKPNFWRLKTFKMLTHVSSWHLLECNLPFSSVFWTKPNLFNVKDWNQSADAHDYLRAELDSSVATSSLTTFLSSMAVASLFSGKALFLSSSAVASKKAKFSDPPPYTDLTDIQLATMGATPKLDLLPMGIDIWFHHSLNKELVFFV